jgi:hypothetical protein
MPPLVRARAHSYDSYDSSDDELPTLIPSRGVPSSQVKRGAPEGCKDPGWGDWVSDDSDEESLPPLVSRASGKPPFRAAAVVPSATHRDPARPGRQPTTATKTESDKESHAAARTLNEPLDLEQLAAVNELTFNDMLERVEDCNFPADVTTGVREVLRKFKDCFSQHLRPGDCARGCSAPRDEPSGLSAAARPFHPNPGRKDEVAKFDAR